MLFQNAIGFFWNEFDVRLERSARASPIGTAVILNKFILQEYQLLMVGGGSAFLAMMQAL